MSWLPLGNVHFFAFSPNGSSWAKASPSSQHCETRRGFPLTFWDGVGSVTRPTAVRVEVALPSSEHALRKVNSSQERGGRNTRFGCAVNPARVVSMMRLQACQCHPMDCLDRTGSTSTLRSSCSALPHVPTGSSLRSFQAML